MTIARILVALALAGGVALGGVALQRWRTRPDRGDQRVPDRVNPGAGGWTILGFTSPMCVACQRTPAVVARALGVGVAALGQGPVRGVAFHSLDVREHPELVDRLDVTRTPTVVVLDPEGRVVHRADANPDPDALQEHVPLEPLSLTRASVGRGAALSVAVPRTGERP